MRVNGLLAPTHAPGSAARATPRLRVGLTESTRANARLGIGSKSNPSLTRRANGVCSRKRTPRDGQQEQPLAYASG
jgi:hypothetical protein